MKSKKRKTPQNLLLFTENEQAVFQLFRSYEFLSAQKIAKLCNISKSSIYTTLERLYSRGLLYTVKVDNGKEYWKAITDGEIKMHLNAAKNRLLLK